ncbi:MAG: hypothetical protein EAZ53_16590 [Bacteroidetes bacterium]|nr:MAG: hypothetical protein EAZ53_16590 [Bacteroidota bacterium]
MTADIQLYNIFKTHFNDADATKIIDYIDAKTEKAIKDETKTFATKEDLAKLEASLIYKIVAIVLGQTALIITLLKVL